MFYLIFTCATGLIFKWDINSVPIVKTFTHSIDMSQQADVYFYCENEDLYKRYRPIFNYVSMSTHTVSGTVSENHNYLYK